MKKVLEIVSQIPLFLGIEKENLGKVLSCLGAAEKSFEREEYIIRAGEKVDAVGVLLCGSANILKEDYWGNRSIVARLSSGEIFAESLACLNAQNAPVSVQSCEKSVVLFLDYRRMLTTCETACSFHTKLIDNMLRILAAKNTMLMQKMEHIVKRSTKEKLLSYFSEQAAAAGENSFDIPFNRQELADYLCVERSAMSAELSRLQKEGLLVYHKNHFTLL